jgi:hypothetical protein
VYERRSSTFDGQMAKASYKINGKRTTTEDTQTTKDPQRYSIVGWSIMAFIWKKLILIRRTNDNKVLLSKYNEVTKNLTEL